VTIEKVAFAKVAADLLTFLWDCDYFTFAQLASDCGITVDEDTAMAAIHRVDALVKAKGKTYTPLYDLGSSAPTGPYGGGKMAMQNPHDEGYRRDAGRGCSKA
jgi:hypothetical protein